MLCFERDGWCVTDDVGYVSILSQTDMLPWDVHSGYTQHIYALKWSRYRGVWDPQRQVCYHCMSFMTITVKSRISSCLRIWNLKHSWLLVSVNLFQTLQHFYNNILLRKNASTVHLNDWMWNQFKPTTGWGDEVVMLHVLRMARHIFVLHFIAFL